MTLNDFDADDLQELIHYHYTSKTPVSPFVFNCPVLPTPMEPEEAQLHNGQIKLLQKVGPGQFVETTVGMAHTIWLQSLSEKEEQRVLEEGDMSYSILIGAEAADWTISGHKSASVAEQMRSCWNNAKDRSDFHRLMAKSELLFMMMNSPKCAQKQNSFTFKT